MFIVGEGSAAVGMEGGSIAYLVPGQGATEAVVLPASVSAIIQVRLGEPTTVADQRAASRSSSPAAIASISSTADGSMNSRH